MKQNHSRYSGPELEVLLDEVRAELGADVTIVEANKIRSGGVGGFFSKELFEVIVDTSTGTAAGHRSDTPPTKPQGAATRSRPASLPDGQDLTVVAGSVDEIELLADSRTLQFDDTTIRHTTRELLARAEAADWPDEPLDVIDESPTSPGTVSFTDVLREELAQSMLDPGASSMMEALLDGDSDGEGERSAPAALEATVLPPVAAPRSGSAPRSAKPSPAAPTSARPTASDLSRPDPIPFVTASSNPRPTGRGFWSRLSSARGEASLLSDIPRSPLAVIAGDLDAGLLAARRRQRDRLMPSDALLVLSRRGDTSGLPSWQCFGDEASLFDALGPDPTQRLVVIDAPPGSRGLGPLMGRLAAHGATAVHMAVSGSPSAEDLDQTVASIGTAVVVDFVSTVAPTVAVSYFDRGIPIGSIGGHRLTAELLVALRREAEDG